jgi:hypothetical protein
VSSVIEPSMSVEMSAGAATLLMLDIAASVPADAIGDAVRRDAHEVEVEDEDEALAPRGVSAPHGHAS